MYGAPLSKRAKKMMLLGSGELGKEVIIEAQRLGVETIAVDRYANAPGMQVAHRSHVIDMLDRDALMEVIKAEQPDIIVPEIEAIATEVLLEVEQEGFHVVPTARATRLTMDREGIRRLAAEELKLPVASYKFADSLEELKQAVEDIGTPCFIKPVMSSSGKGQSVCKDYSEVEKSWDIAMKGSRGKSTRVIVEEFIEFESEITLLTVRSISGTTFCAPIGHVQKDGDYIESWQPHNMDDWQIEESKRIAKVVTDELGGYGLFGVELFIGKDKVYFSEVSPRPHDTGMVTLVTQDLSEFALHVRAILGFPIPSIQLLTPGATYTLKAGRETTDFSIENIGDALQFNNTQVRVFGKPETKVGRRMAVALSTEQTTELARETASKAAKSLRIDYYS
ncbi:formate-dependent phosphoribosylglycinamide formyltransferase [Desulfuribacillus alkaliarsenatis]|uniref:Formate-dependent phosphoribosylglycinamide formyltransferase n=1 Tax=Desulfuribacillus alkaliarsenatis TaxID=766136 RepID=A0A1E5G3D2_9FIRM|nr:formate-dependent phosphoribosylglycinamide formyltransferase [Desulfuribacillus alkaliarsenatis]OEF97494.1 phosphoribosylglycinamide formyltransferase 2 [Desulfuribacillus alkaliarsenatis]